MVPIVTPAIVMATSVYIAFLQWRLVGSLTGYVLAHAAIATPFVVVSVTSALGTFDPTLLRAAASLGASPFRAFLTVTMPLIGRGVQTGAILAFVTSFDEVVIAVFIRSPELPDIAGPDVQQRDGRDRSHGGSLVEPDRHHGQPASFSPAPS